MGNLLKETKDVLKENGKTIKDIIAVQGMNFGIPVDLFLKLADTLYDSGYGSTKVADDLIVIGKDFWLERHEYDGSEWWEYKELPKILENIVEVSALTVNQCEIRCSCGWNTLKELNFESED